MNFNFLKIHKSVIQSRSTIFKNVCKSEPGIPLPTASPENSDDAAILYNCKYEIVERAVMFCYDLPFIDNLSDEDAIRLLKFSEEFEMNDLKKNMEEYCIKTLSISNGCLFANSSIKTNAENLYQKCFDFLLKCMKDGTSVKDIEKLDDGMQKELFVKAFNTS
uniref:BTB domain-containing protein n=1 Tax=Panagrolaimus davidi TaxID=227884 RepID=A0A914PEV1_9BILA